MSQTHELEVFEETVSRIYHLIPESESTMHHTFTPDAAFASGRWKLNKRRKNVVFFNWEEVVRLVRFHGFDPRKLTFVSDGDWKSQSLTTYCPEVTIVKYNDRLMTKYAKKFHGGAINPPFGESKRLRAIAEQLVTDKLLVVSPTRDFENPKSLEDIEYYYPLGDRAFSEQISTALCIVDVTGTKQETVIEDCEGRRIKVVDMPFAPGEDLDDWLYAIQILNLGLPGYECQYGEISLVKDQPKYQFNGSVFSVVTSGGIPLVFNPGSKDSEFKKVVNIETQHQDKATGYGKKLLIVSKNGSIGKLGPIKIKPEDYGHGHNTISLTNVDENEINEALEYLNSPEVARLVRGIKTNTIINGVNLWKKIPHHQYKDQWISKL